MKRKVIKEIEFLEKCGCNESDLKKLNEKFKLLIETIKEDRWIKK